MKKNYFAYWGLCIFFLNIVAIPPIFINTNDRCWSHTGLQLLFNMSYITNELTQKKFLNSKVVQNDSFLKAYTELFTEALNDVDRGMSEESDKKAQVLLGLPKECWPESIVESITENKQDDTSKFMMGVFSLFEKNNLNIYEKYSSIQYQEPMKLKSHIYSTLAPSGNERFGEIVKMPTYYIYAIINTEDVINMSDEQWANAVPVKAEIGGDAYELISIAVHKGGENDSGHWVAYILDQFASKPKWYLCDDIAKEKVKLQDLYKI